MLNTPAMILMALLLTASGATAAWGDSPARPQLDATAPLLFMQVDVP